MTPQLRPGDGFAPDVPPPESDGGATNESALPRPGLSAEERLRRPVTPFHVDGFAPAVPPQGWIQPAGGGDSPNGPGSETGTFF